MAMFLRYVFFRVSKWQLKRTSDAEEAALTAILYMSLSPMALIVSADMLVARSLGREPFFNLISKWPYAIAILLVVYAVHYVLFVREKKFPRPELEFRGKLAARFGTPTVVAYLFPPTLAMSILAGVLGRGLS
jgi:hypothetical protein